MISHRSQMATAPAASYGWAARGRQAMIGALLMAAAGPLAQQAVAQSQQDRPQPEPVPPVTMPDLSRVLNAILGQSDQTLTVAAAPAPTPTPVIPDPMQVSSNETGLLDVHVRDMQISTVLEMLSYEAQANIVTSTSVTGTVSANLYGVTLEQALDAVLTPNRYVFYQSGATYFVGTAEDLSVLLPPPVTRVFRLRYIRPPEAAAAVRAILGSDANVVEGGGDEESGAGGGGAAEVGAMGPVGVDYLIVTATPAGLEAVEKLLAEIDRRPQQVLVEATVLRATLSETNEFGIDFTFLDGVDFQAVSSRSTGGTNLITGDLPADQLQNRTIAINTDFAGNVSEGGFTFGLIANNLAVFIRALERVTDVVVVANPKIVALNKREAQVMVGRRDGYLTTTVTETAAVQTVEFLDTGTQILFRPVINDDGTVRMFVHPKDSFGGLTDAQLPFEETTEAHADILVNDGETVLIGGLFRERTSKSRQQIPVLGNIPWAGLLFGSQSDDTIREEIIILLTVHIIKDTPEEQAEYQQMMDDIERVRVGTRKGLMGTGRERLAQAHYSHALSLLERGDLDGALLNTRLALQNQPGHISAIQLKERLLNQRMWEDEGCRMRTFVQELIELERTERFEKDDPPAQLGSPYRPRNGGLTP